MDAPPQASAYNSPSLSFLAPPPRSIDKGAHMLKRGCPCWLGYLDALLLALAFSSLSPPLLTSPPRSIDRDCYTSKPGCSCLLGWSDVLAQAHASSPPSPSFPALLLVAIAHSHDTHAQKMPCNWVIP